MARLWSDTHPDAERVLIELLRQAPPWRKLQLVSQMTRTCQLLAMAGLRQRHPDDTPEQLRMRLAELTLGRETAERVYGRLPDREGEGAAGAD
jgi:hypothetical protein